MQINLISSSLAKTKALFKKEGCYDNNIVLYEMYYILNYWFIALHSYIFKQMAKLQKQNIHPIFFNQNISN